MPRPALRTGLVGFGALGAAAGLSFAAVAVCKEADDDEVQPDWEAIGLSPWQKFGGLYSGVPLKIFSGNAHPALASKVAETLGEELAEAKVSKFKNGETNVSISKSVRDCDVFIIQPTCNPNPNDYIMELVIMLDAMRRAGAARVTAVCPIYGYARQDKKDESRAPITAKVVADVSREQ